MLKFPNRYGLGYGQLINQGENGFKSPMLIVGSNNWIRQNVSADFLKEWDIFLFFFPTSEPNWKVGALYMSREGNLVHLEWVQSYTIESALVGSLIYGKDIHSKVIELDALNPKAFAWLNLSVYRCPKISLADVLVLENYEGVGLNSNIPNSVSQK